VKIVVDWIRVFPYIGFIGTGDDAMLAEINRIKTVARAEAVYTALFASYSQRVGEKQAAHSDRMILRSSHFKVGGLAWWKDRVRAVAHLLVSTESTVNHFIPASPETEAWGGFLGGERLTYTDRNAADAAEEMIAGRIAGL
jgi:hypothetical protein